MYNPSRGGVRGGADQFTWESVKTDKHRENYLGHSLKAPVGRWQKGKDLSWYAKERKEENAAKSERSELAAIKRAEEEAMLIALGHNIVRKESQTLTKEEMSEVLKRNVGERDELNIERVDGVGATSRRAALLSGAGKNSKDRSEGVVFETHHVTSAKTNAEIDSSPSSKMKKTKKSSKHKKEKKKKKHRKDSTGSEEASDIKCRTYHKKYRRDSSGSEETSDLKFKTKHKKHRRGAPDSEEASDYKYETKHKRTIELNKNEIDRSHSKVGKKKKSSHKHRYNSDPSDSERDGHSYFKHKTYKRQEKDSDTTSAKRRRHDTSESD